jgi:hypothetical protein
MTDHSDPNSPDNGTESARLPRQSVFLSATLQQFGSKEASKHRVRDLSEGGMRIDKAAGLQVGATVLVSVGVLQAVDATVVWLRDGWAGLRFAALIDAEQARGKAAVTPKARSSSSEPLPDNSPTAGWIQDLNNPYRK